MKVLKKRKRKRKGRKLDLYDPFDPRLVKSYVEGCDRGARGGDDSTLNNPNSARVYFPDGVPLEGNIVIETRKKRRKEVKKHKVTHEYRVVVEGDEALKTDWMDVPLVLICQHRHANHEWVPADPDEFGDGVAFKLEEYRLQSELFESLPIA